jgi:hypothetical protein
VALSASDTAPASIGLHDYDLPGSRRLVGVLGVSSVFSAGIGVEAVGTVPELGSAGNLLNVAEARSTLAPGEEGPACAAIGWGLPREDARVIYEASRTDHGMTRREICERSGRLANSRTTTTGTSARRGGT